MRKIIMLLVSVMVLSAGSACSHSKSQIKDTAPAVADENAKTLTAEIVKVKNTGKAVEINIALRNTYDHPVAFKKASWGLQFGDEKGTVGKYKFVGDIEAGRNEKAFVQFKFAKPLPPSGHLILTIDPIFEGIGVATPVPALKHEFDIAP